MRILDQAGYIVKKCSELDVGLFGYRILSLVLYDVTHIFSYVSHIIVARQTCTVIEQLLIRNVFFKQCRGAGTGIVRLGQECAY